MGREPVLRWAAAVVQHLALPGQLVPDIDVQQHAAGGAVLGLAFVEQRDGKWRGHLQVRSPSKMLVSLSWVHLAGIWNAPCKTGG